MSFISISISSCSQSWCWAKLNSSLQLLNYSSNERKPKQRNMHLQIFTVTRPGRKVIFFCPDHFIWGGRRRLCVAHEWHQSVVTTRYMQLFVSHTLARRSHMSTKHTRDSGKKKRTAGYISEYLEKRRVLVVATWKWLFKCWSGKVNRAEHASVSSNIGTTYTHKHANCISPCKA